MRQFLPIGMIALAMVAAGAQATTSVERSEQYQADGLEAEYSFYGELDLFAAPEEDTAYTSADAFGSYGPDESIFAPDFDGMQMLLGLLPETELATPTLTTAETEADAIVDEGASVHAAAEATEDEVHASYEAQAGARSIQGEASAEVPEPVPDEPSAAESEPPAPPPEPAVEEEATPEREVAVAAPMIEPQSSYAIDVPPVSPVVVATLAVATLTTSAVFVFVPGWRTAVWKLARRVGGLFLFSRIAQSDILNHERRSELVEFVKQNPGERVEIARRALGFSNGSMHYHLRVLQDRDLVRVLKDQGCARLFLAGPKIQAVPYVPSQRKRFLDLLGRAPGLTQREAALQLGLSERMVSYHVRTLIGQGFVEAQSEGARKRLYLRALVSA